MRPTGLVRPMELTSQNGVPRGSSGPAGGSPPERHRRAAAHAGDDSGRGVPKGRHGAGPGGPGARDPGSAGPGGTGPGGTGPGDAGPGERRARGRRARGGQADWRAGICWLITVETPSPRIVMP
jgi:hypothetical protein